MNIDPSSGKNSVTPSTVPEGPSPGEKGSIATATEPTSYLPKRDGHSSLPPEKTLNKRQVSQPQLQTLKAEWQRIIANFQKEYDYDPSDDVLYNCLRSEVRPFVQKLCQLSGGKEQLSPELVTEYEQIVKAVALEVTPARPDKTIPEILGSVADDGRTGQRIGDLIPYQARGLLDELSGQLLGQLTGQQQPDQALPPKPKFPLNPIEVKNFQFGKAIKLNPVTPEVAREFKKAIEQPGVDRSSYLGFNRIMTSCIKKLAVNKNDELIAMRGIGHARGTSDDTFDFVISPNLHSQVHITDAGGKSKGLCANHIQYDGQPAGIAMPAPREENLPDLMRMAWENNSHVFLDLLSNPDRAKEAQMETDNFWLKLPVEPNYLDLKGFHLSRKGEPVTHQLKTEAAQLFTQNPVKIHGITAEPIHEVDSLKSEFARVIIQKLLLTAADGSQRNISYISFPNWRDGSPIEPEQMAELQDKVAEEEALYPDRQGLVVNCLAGVGRTGSFFATRHLRNKAEAKQLDPDNVPSEVFSVILQGKLYRNDMFVQYASQAKMVSDMGHLYARRQKFAPDSSPKDQDTPDTTGKED